MHINQIFKKMFYCTALAALLSAASCGLRDDPESASGSDRDTSVMQSSYAQSEEQTKESDTQADGAVAVADFHYLDFDYSFFNYMRGVKYTINDEWLYHLVSHSPTPGTGKLPSTYISRYRLSVGHQDLKYIMTGRAQGECLERALLADSAGNCYLFGKLGKFDDEDTSVYQLEKYGPEGELLWRTEHTPADLSGMGFSLTEGLVTKDGRVFLYEGGARKTVFAFDKEGKLLGTYDPPLELLDGLAEGKDGKVYAYCITAEEPLFIELDGDSALAYTCPFTPLAAHSGYENGLCLRTAEGVWRYEPETEEIEPLWKWQDEYIQIDGNNVDRFFCGDDKFTALCFEQMRMHADDHTREQLTFASITLRDRQDYPEKKRSP